MQKQTVREGKDTGRKVMLFSRYIGTLNHIIVCKALLMLRNELRPVIRTKPRRRLSERVLVIHDNLRPHTAAMQRKLFGS
jgi:hypothetical protein